MVRLTSRRRKTPVDAVAPDVYPTDLAADDHGLHYAGEQCAHCGRAIGPDDEARRTASGGFSHLSC